MRTFSRLACRFTAFASFLLATLSLAAGAWAQDGPQAQAACQPLYLVFDTGHMDAAPMVAESLRRQGVRATFFGGNEGGSRGEGSLSRRWASWWKARAADGHEFAMQTWDMAQWRGDLPGREPRFRIRPGEGAFAGREFTWTAAQYCENIAFTAERLSYYSGKPPLPLFRAVGGRTSPRLLAAAKACGYRHVDWKPAPFLGHGMPSGSQTPNEAFLERALKDVQAGDVLLAGTSAWARQEAWAPAMLGPLLAGLKARGFCFRTLREHPHYQDWLARHAPRP